MSEDKKSLIDLIPDSVDNAVKNITDKPTKNIGTTLADIWYLVFGGISQAAEKRKLKYSYSLQEFEKELQEKISKIPEDKLVDPDIQVVAKALEESKYCMDKEELRHMFSSLISSSMNKDFSVSPVIVNIVSSLSPVSAKILKYLYQFHENISKEIMEVNKFLMSNKSIYTDAFLYNKMGELQKKHIDVNELRKYLNIAEIEIINSLIELEHLDLIYYRAFKEINDNKEMNNLVQNISGKFVEFENIVLSPLGCSVCFICL